MPFLDGKLGDHQFNLNAAPKIPENGLLAQFYSLQTDTMNIIYHNGFGNGV